MKIWGHRGASAYAPENTLAAFHLAHVMGADGVECDVQFTKDRHVVVLHDTSLFRTAYVNRLLCDMTLSEVKQLDNSCGMRHYRGEKVPTLGELLELARTDGFDVNIELKTNFDEPCGLEEAVCRIVSEHGMEKHVIYSGNNHISLVHMKKINPTSECNLGFYQKCYREWDYAKMLGCDGIHPDYRFVDRTYVDACKNAGIICRVWAPDQPEDIRSMLQLGLDILTNKPDIAVEIRRNILNEDNHNI